ncbi:MAG: hypothetical protein KGK00_04140 [Paracoccaceae bacterium]|nr:hypothetical protein [Paracoccaceae bacterium]
MAVTPTTLLHRRLVHPSPGMKTAAGLLPLPEPPPSSHRWALPDCTRHLGDVCSHARRIFILMMGSLLKPASDLRGLDAPELPLFI